MNVTGIAAVAGGIVAVPLAALVVWGGQLPVPALPRVPAPASVRAAPAPSAAEPVSTSPSARAPAGPAAPLGPAALGLVRAVVERARPAVVQITTQTPSLDQLGRPTVGSGVGSGVIYDASGLILTNNHVVEGARTLSVALPDGRVYSGRLLGGDPQMDLAVVRIQAGPGEALPTAPLGSSSPLRVGDWVVAIGNALGLPGGPTVTAGVVSAVGRAIQEPGDGYGPGPYLYDLIQTDAAINPGNSGGPLLSLTGEVVGINTLGSGAAAQGIGFAISVDTARPIAEQLATAGRVRHPFLGIAYAPVSPAVAAQLNLPSRQGAVLTQVLPNGPAARAGVRVRDVVVAVDGQPVVDETTLGRALNRRAPGDRIVLAVARDGERLDVTVTAGERPDR